MRTVSGPLTAMLASREHTRARCVYMALRDGTVIVITDHDRDLVVDMADISDVPVVYKANTGVLTSDINLAVGLDADTLEISGPISNVITRPQVIGRRFSGARIRVFDVNWNAVDQGVIAYLGGSIGETNVKGGQFLFEIRSHTDAFNQTIGRVISPYCSADFGDAQCGFAVPEILSTVIGVVSDFQLAVDLAADYPNDFFNLGRIEFISGGLRGTDAVEIFDYDGASGGMELFVPLAARPEIGDEVIMRIGCSKLHKSDDASVRTCVSYGNARRFRGFKDVPGSDQYLKMPIPGGG